mmetsp:Transcript_63179/g.105099  ORF Transcript_63179/g.105099 Transcript_63179/m.105099 type:complete len:395 (-) Transcript_63179:505-1689(-)
MFSPRKTENDASSSGTPATPTPRSAASGSSLLSGLGKMLWQSPSDSPVPRDSDASGFMTQSPRRFSQASASDPGSPGSQGSRFSAPPSAALPSGADAGSDKRGLLDIFSPMFTFFAGRSEAAPGKSTAVESRPSASPEDCGSPGPHTAPTTVASTCPGPAMPPPATSPAEADEPGDEEEMDEFDPYLFIRSLPPRPPMLTKPICLPKKTRGTHSVSLVLDLDETLLHSSIVPLPTYDIVFPVHFNAINYQVYVRKRPHMDYFMNRVSQLFEIIVFTASQKVYADRLLNIIDPHRKWIKHRVFRDSCVVVEGNYLKDLTVLGRDLSKTTIVDNSPQAFGFQVDNGIPIESWFDDPSDTELLKLLPFLESLAEVDDVRPLVRQQFQLYKRVNPGAA